MDNYFVHASGMKDGNHGCELWISSSCGISMRDVVVSSASPRHLLCAIRSKVLTADVLVAHAPQSGSGMDKVSQWWADLTRITRTRKSPKPLICLFDANAQVGSETSLAIGDRAAESESESGVLFHEYLMENDICLPATFGDQVHETEYTWASPVGTFHRCDYV